MRPLQSRFSICRNNFLKLLILLLMAAFLSPHYGSVFAASREKVQWIRQGTGAYYSAATAVATDRAGNIYLAGNEKRPSGGSATAVSQSSFIIKFDPAGKQLWTAGLSTGGSDSIQGVAVDESGNVYVTGFTSGSVAGSSNAGDNDIFLAKFDNGGSPAWARQFGTASRDCAYALALDRDRNIYIAGYTWGSFDNSRNAGGSDILVIKVSGSGEKLWSRQTGTPSLDMATGIAIDSSGLVHVTGYTLGSFSGFRNAGGSDIFLITYDPAGKETGLIQDGSGGNDFANGIVTDKQGNRYIAGHTWGSFGETPNAGLADFFIACYSPGGERIWTRQSGSAAWDEATAVTLDSDGNLVVAGHTYGSLEANVSAGNDDLFVVKYQLDGTMLYSSQFGTPQLDYAKAVAAGDSGEILVAGHTKGSFDGSTVPAEYGYLLMKLAPEASLRILPPDREGSWTAGEIATIGWEYSGNPGRYVSLSLHKNGASLRNIGIASVKSGLFRWKVPADLVQADDYTVGIRILANPSIADMSGTFTIRQSSGFSVEAPGNGKKVYSGEVVDIRWSSSGDPGIYALLALNKSGGYQRGIGAAKSSDSLFRWSVPPDVPAGNDYSIQIRSLSNPAVSGTGSAFEIKKITMPRTGDKSPAASTMDILDRSSGFRR